ncbi:MAG: RIP metalloprotease RseP [Desulfobacterota bacterium]|jgi:regulator of sigma E protease|nr:RIP metalloprotease RseP [Thermodesulfobacteriota bacterium]
MEALSGFFFELTLAASTASPGWASGFLFKVLSFVVVLGLLIFFHELGHFLAAKFFGVRVIRFSFGLGPRLLGVKVGETDYCLSAFPLGGFVKMVGEGTEDEVAPEEEARSFANKPVWQRMVIVFCGPLFNFFFAFAVFTLVFATMGQMDLTNEIGEIKPGYPAAQAGLRPGDKIVQIGATPVSRWKELPEIVRRYPDQAVPLVFEREGRRQQTVVTPIRKPVKNIFGEETQEAVIGITPASRVVTRQLGPWEAILDGGLQTWNITRMTVISLVKLIERKIPLETLGGPIFIAQLAGQQAQEGWLNLIFFTALLSVNLGILNLLPIPILDGGHIFFFAVEAVLRKPLSLKARERAQQVGMFILIVLMVFVFYNDILRLLRP